MNTSWGSNQLDELKDRADIMMLCVCACVCVCVCASLVALLGIVSLQIICTKQLRLLWCKTWCMQGHTMRFNYLHGCFHTFCIFSYCDTSQASLSDLQNLVCFVTFHYISLHFRLEQIHIISRIKPASYACSGCLHAHTMNVQSLPGKCIIVVESNADALWGRSIELDGVEAAPPLNQCTRTRRLLNQHTLEQQHILLNWGRERKWVT